MSTARLTLEITHPSEKGVHQELLQYEFPINKDGNWVQSLLDYISNNKEKENDNKKKVGKKKSKPKIIT
jgi:hypothetical protein